MTEQYSRAYWEQRLAGLSLARGHFIDGKFVPRSFGTDLHSYAADGRPARRGFGPRRCRRCRCCRRLGPQGLCQQYLAGQGAAGKKKVMLRWADLIRAHGEELALLETLDVGKPVQASLGVDVRLCADGIQYYGEMIDKLYDEIAPTGPKARALVRKVPLGVVAAITPWNYPMIIDAWKLGPAIAAGNSVVLKPAGRSSLRAGLAGTRHRGRASGRRLQCRHRLRQEVGKPLALHGDVDMVAFTGSTEVGKLIMGYAAQSNLKRVALELGGKSPLVVFEDADLDAAASAAAWGCFYNSGETCHAATRASSCIARCRMPSSRRSRRW